jgi:hypothetical protein
MNREIHRPRRVRKGALLRAVRTADRRPVRTARNVVPNTDAGQAPLRTLRSADEVIE